MHDAPPFALILFETILHISTESGQPTLKQLPTSIMNFKLGIFALFVIFSLARGADINIQNCDNTQQSWVQNAIVEAQLFAGRAAKTLQEALDSPVAEGIPSEIQTLLDAFLAPKAPKDKYQSILGKS